MVTTRLLLESLAIAYELTGDASYLKYGLKTFRKTINEASGGAVGIKTITDDAVICKGGFRKKLCTELYTTDYIL